MRPERSDLPATEALAFRHLLLRDAAYDAIPKATRAELHEGFADWLEAAAKGSMSELDEIVGYHLELAVTYRGELGPLDEATLMLSKGAGRRLISSGLRAWNRGDALSTVNLLTRAVRLPLIETADWLDALITLAQALVAAGRLDEVAPVLRECSDLAAESGDGSAKLEAELQMIMLELAMDPSASFVESVRRVEAMLPELEERGNHRDLARAWYRLGVMRFWGGAAESSLEALALAHEHATEAADTPLALETLWSMIGPLLWGPTPVQEVIKECARIKALAPTDLRVSSSCDCLHAYCLVIQRHFDEGITLAAQALGGWEELGLTLDLASGKGMFLGVMLALAGRSSEAVRLQRESVDTLTRIGETGYLSTIAAYLAITLIGIGRPDEAEHHALLSRDTAADDDLASQVLWRTALAAAATSQGDLVEAEQLARESVELARAMDYLVMLADALVILGEVLRKMGLPQEARAKMSEAATLYERKGYRVGYSVGL